MSRIIISTVFLFWTIISIAQNSVGGVVRYAGDGSYATSINVIVSDPGQSGMLVETGAVQVNCTKV